MLPKCGTLCLMPLWCMNKAFAGGRRCIFVFTKTSQEVFFLFAPACFGGGKFCWVTLATFNEEKSKNVNLSSSFSCRTWLLECCRSSYQPVSDHIVAYAHSPFFWGKVWPPTVTPNVCVWVNTCQWISPCAVSPCGVLMLWACAKLGEHNYMIIWESVEMKFLKKRTLFLAWKVKGKRRIKMSNCIHVVMQQRDISWTVFLHYFRLLQSI